MKKVIAAPSMLIISLSTFACPMCEKQQPKVLKGIVHGGVPDGNLDYFIVTSVAIITLVTLVFAVKWIIKPGEKDKNHIKYSSIIFQ